ncbi:hypothetical protein GPECTOR_8g71 [Gonium pectorale]|uniref:Uncharacterized protein n=1 Tax=Gonium pectorale TaxID=33097 RepID=A0A150GT98_GONPE|nr:hypothetical protein GPECTOR_8g71 [Gonium pectorale]|eukprot:KXZ53079.1 hypothetical protein GPECTOR_8g71 [Gonium pectorale]
MQFALCLVSVPEMLGCALLGAWALVACTPNFFSSGRPFGDAAAWARMQISFAAVSKLDTAWQVFAAVVVSYLASSIGGGWADRRKDLLATARVRRTLGLMMEIPSHLVVDPTYDTDEQARRKAERLRQITTRAMTPPTVWERWCTPRPTFIELFWLSSTVYGILVYGGANAFLPAGSRWRALLAWPVLARLRWFAGLRALKAGALGWGVLLVLMYCGLAAGLWERSWCDVRLAAKVNLIAVRAWKVDGLDGVQTAMEAMRVACSEEAAAAATNGGSRITWPMLTNLALASFLALWLFAYRPNWLRSPEAFVNTAMEAAKAPPAKSTAPKARPGTSKTAFVPASTCLPDAGVQHQQQQQMERAPKGKPVASFAEGRTGSSAASALAAALPFTAALGGDARPEDAFPASWSTAAPSAAATRPTAGPAAVAPKQARPVPPPPLSQTHSPSVPPASSFWGWAAAAATSATARPPPPTTPLRPPPVPASPVRQAPAAAPGTREEPAAPPTEQPSPDLEIPKPIPVKAPVAPPAVTPTPAAAPLVGVNPALAHALRRTAGGAAGAAAPGVQPLTSQAAGGGVAGRVVPVKKLCFRCNAQARVGVVHGRFMHLCLCSGCGQGFSVGDPCPECGEPATSVLSCFLA